MTLKFTFYIPRGSEEAEDVKRIDGLLTKIRSSNNVEIDREVIDNKEGEDKLKFDVLIPLAVYKRIKINQTRRTKSLYPQLVVFSDDKAITFYPQSYGSERIGVEDFLKGFLGGKVSCLHEAYELKKMVGK